MTLPHSAEERGRRWGIDRTLVLVALGGVLTFALLALSCGMAP